MQRIYAPFELKSAQRDGTFTGYASVFGNIDLDDDIIEAGAFKKFKTTRDGQIRIGTYHRLDQLAGKAKVKQDEHGLFVEAKLSLGVSYVKDVYELMKDDVLDGLSVGFNVLNGGSEWREINGKDVRVITAAELWEFSIVPFGANPEALIEAVKAANIRDFEAQLRGLGYSRRDAKALAGGGFSSLARRDVVPDSEKLAEAKRIFQSM